MNHNKIVYINGVMQDPADYITTPDGQVLFKTKPLLEDDIRVVNVPSVPAENNITFKTGTTDTPILQINEDGFWVRGVKVEQDEKEAATVYRAFKQFMVEAELRRKW